MVNRVMVASEKPQLNQWETIGIVASLLLI